MAKLMCGASLGTIILNEPFGKISYYPYNERQWSEVQNILSEFGITLFSRYAINFEGEAYKLRSIPGYFGSQDVEIFYKDVVIAKATVEGSNYCDRSTKLTINFDALRSIYHVDSP